MHKKIICISLALIICFSMAIPSFAIVGQYTDSIQSDISDKDTDTPIGFDDTQGKQTEYSIVIDGTTDTEIAPFDSQTDVYATQATVFSVKIPKTIILNSNGYGEFTASVKGDISGTQTISVIPSGNNGTRFELVEVIPGTSNPTTVGHKDNIIANIVLNDTDWKYSTDFSTVDDITWVNHDGSIIANDISAGSWMGTFNFEISLIAESRVATNYTSEEISQNPLMFGIGRTKSEYVIAEFNEDYTSVDIYANDPNGEVSDGLIKNYAGPTKDPNYPIYNNKSTLKSIVVKEGIKEIGINGFAQLTNLETVTLPNSLEVIAAGAFTSDKALKSINLPNNITEIGLNALRNCTALDIDLVMPRSLTTIGKSAFYGDTKIKSVALNDGLESIGEYAFYNCTGMTGNLYIPSSVRTIENSAFRECTGLNGKLILNEGLETIGGYAFDGCSKLTGDLKMPSTVKSINGWAFQSCRGFNGVLTLNDGLEFIGDGAFNHCCNFKNKSLSIPSTVETIGGMKTPSDTTVYAAGTHIFYNFATSTLQSFNVSDENNNFKDIDGVLFTKDATRLISYPSSKNGRTYEIPEGVTIIDELAFGRTGEGGAIIKLNSITIPDSYVIQSFGMPGNFLNKDAGNSLDIALYNFAYLDEVKVKDSNTRYTNIDGCVYSKDVKTLYYVPLNKTSIVIPDTVTKIEKGAIAGAGKKSESSRPSGCYSLLENITIPASCTTIYDCDLESLNSLITYNNTTIILSGSNSNLYFDGTKLCAHSVLNGDGYMEI